MKTLFGLPSDVHFCKKCVISNQRPSSAFEYLHNKDSKKNTIGFSDEGICDACIIAEKKKNIDWNERENKLINLCNKHRSKNGNYDCIVPGSGGKDSFYASYILKYKYNMNPLTVTWSPNLFTDWGLRNYFSWINTGFDNVFFNTNGKIKRLLTRLSIENLFHPFQAFILGQKSIGPRMADLKKIPLVFYGENEAEYGNPIQTFNRPQRSNNYFSSNIKKHFLGGVEVERLIKDFKIKKSDLELYLPFEYKSKIDVHYLGYYLKWHPQSCYYFSKEKSNFETAPFRNPGTYSKYNSIDDKIDDLHYFCTYIKFGIGRASYDASQEIRNNEITRSEGISLVKKYDGEFPNRFINELFQYLSIDIQTFGNIYKKFKNPIMNQDYFDHLSNNFRSPHLWKKNKSKWQLRKTVY